MPLEISRYDSTDYLDSEEAIAEFLEAAWIEALGVEDMEKRFAYLASCYEAIMHARQRWLLSKNNLRALKPSEN